MKVQLPGCVVVLWAVALGTFPGVESQALPCGFYEEGSNQGITCSTKTQEFNRWEVRVEINGTFEERSYCDSTGNCVDNEQRYYAIYSYDPETTRKNVTLHISGVSRQMTRARCYMDGNALFSTECVMQVYVSPNQPTCSGPDFINGGRAAVISCTSDRVYPTATCGLRVKAGNDDFEQNHLLSVTDELIPSSQYPGDFELTCHFEINLDGILEDPLRLSVIFYPRIPQDKVQASTVSVVDSLPSLDLKATALSNPGDSNIRVDFDPETGRLTLPINVDSNPPPYIFSLTMKEEESSTHSDTVPSNHYTVEYAANPDDGKRGTLTLSLASEVIPRGQRDAFFTFVAGNAVVGSAAFQFLFTADALLMPPAQPTCEAPVFEDKGATALITCTADRVYPTGECDFQLISEGLSLARAADVTTAIEDSISYPGDKKVTCRLSFPVAENMAGQYRFRVEITAVDGDKRLSRNTSTPTVELKPPALNNPADNNHVFDSLESGELHVDVHVIGSPMPTMVSLWMRHGESGDQVPVSSRDFQWSYEPSVGYEDAGVLQLTVPGSSDAGGDRRYTVKVHNGVVGGSEFEYSFTVNDKSDPPGLTNPDSDSQKDDGSGDNLPIIIGAAAGGLVIVLIIVVVVIVVKMRGRRSQSGDSTYDKPDFDPPPIYSTAVGSPNNNPACSTFNPYSSPLPQYYLTPLDGRPQSNISEPEYCEPLE